MPHFSPQLIVVIAAVGLLVLAARLHDRTHAVEDFLYARRRLPPRIAELSIALVQVPPWMLLAIVLLAHRLGFAAAWIALAAWLGVFVGVFWLAPRVRQRSLAQHAATLARLINLDAGEQMLLTIRRSIVAVVVLCLSLSVGVQFEWIGTQLAQFTEAPRWLILAGSAGVLLACGLLGGLWTAAMTDAILAILLAIIGAIIAIAAASANGWSLPAFDAAAAMSRPAWHSNVLGLAFAIGVAFLIASAFAQPAAVTRYLAQRADTARRVPWFALGWPALALSLSLCIGWLARSQTDADILVVLTRWLPSAAQAIWTTLLCIGMAAQLSHCIAAASHLAHDGLAKFDTPIASQTLTRYRWALAICVALAVLAGSWANGLDTMWFAWHAVTAALGPLLIVRLSGKNVRPGSILGSIWAGFALTVIFHAMPDTPGDLLERGVPFIAALGIALSGGERRRNPDRADRGDRTVHDHLPI